MIDQEQLPPAMFVRTAYTWFAYALLGFFSFFVNVLGPLMPFLRAEMGLSYTLASLHFSAFAAGRVAAGLASDRLIARFGRHKVAWGGVIGAALGSLCLFFGRDPAITIGGTLVMGALGASIPVIIQAVLADQHGPLRAVAFAEANAFASASGSLAPLFLSFLARTSLGWRSALLMPVLALLPLFLAFRGLSLERMTRPRASRIRNGAALPGTYWAYWLVLVLAVAVEFCIIYWVADFLEQARGLARADAALSTSVFLVSMLIGRTLGSWVLRRSQSIRLLLASAGLAAAGFLLHWQASSLLLIEAGLFIAGFGVANLYPLGLTFAMGTAPGQTDKASARSALAVALAILCLPLILGRLADLSGIATAYGLVALLLALLIGMVPLARSLDLARVRRLATPSTRT